MSNMVVRTNVFALNAHRNLTNVGLAQRKSAQRLSSGFRINSAADDAAGLAISESMRAQIRGLDQASINSQDAVGLIQTAEGAMATVSDMIIRMRELMVQAANDTNTWENREMIQLEIDQLMHEINNVTFRTEFNTRTLLDGGLTGGGGPTSPVSLQWMLFDQMRVIGLPHPGGTVGPHGTHFNPNNKNETSLRHAIIELQCELNDLARRVANRLVASGELSPDLRSQIFESYPHDFTMLIPHMVNSEMQQMRSIQNRVESALRGALRAAEETFQIAQDQINALGGMGAINSDGSRVFIQRALEEWHDVAEGARARLYAIRTALTSVSLPIAPQGYFSHLTNMDDIQTLNNFILHLVGYPGGTLPITGTPPPITPPTLPPVGTPPSAMGDRIIDFNGLTGTQSGDGWSFSGGVLTITGSGDFQINGTGVATSNRIVVQSGTTANIMLNNANINTAYGAALDMRNAEINLWIEGNNTLSTAHAGSAGIQNTDGRLVIDGSGSLEASSDAGINVFTGAGIGGGLLEDGGDTTIIGGTVTARGGHGAAGIGGGTGDVDPDERTVTGNGGNITISGNAIVTANGSSAGIGGGSRGHGGNITISGNAIVTANSSGSGAGIGGGFGGAILLGDLFAGHGGNITIADNANVVARGASGAAGIGGGRLSGHGGNIVITGGTIIAIAGAHGPDYENQPHIHHPASAIGRGVGFRGISSYGTFDISGYIGDYEYWTNFDNTEPYNIIWRGTRGSISPLTNVENFRFISISPPTTLPYPPNGGNGMNGEGLIYNIERLLGLGLGALGTVNLESNAMWFQIGANAMQGTVLQLKGIHTGILGGGRGDLVTLIDVRERSGIPISEQLDIIDIAEGIVNAQRAQLGAVQNRLEFTRQSVDISSENLTAAESRIRDTDMAREMMRFTAAQVLQQAGISMLAQANQLPASILQLLQA